MEKTEKVEKSLKQREHIQQYEIDKEQSRSETERDKTVPVTNTARIITAALFAGMNKNNKGCD
jgi:hypothetical protein